MQYIHKFNFSIVILLRKISTPIKIQFPEWRSFTRTDYPLTYIALECFKETWDWYLNDLYHDCKKIVIFELEYQNIGGGGAMNEIYFRNFFRAQQPETTYIIRSNEKGIFVGSNYTQLYCIRSNMRHIGNEVYILQNPVAPNSCLYALLWHVMLKRR